MSNKDTPLTERQAALLEAMRDGEDYTNTLLIAKMMLSKNGQDVGKLAWNIDRLKARQMIDVWSKGRGRVYKINQVGRVALRERQVDMRMHDGTVAGATSRGRLMDLPVYVPRPFYVRDTGHMDIKSRSAFT